MRARALVRGLLRRGETLALAESVTGGRVAAEITAVPGASKVLLEARVVYTEAAKRRLGLSKAFLKRHGTVSAETTLALAKAVRKATGATWGLAVTGIAGPSGGNRRHPVGTAFATVVGPSRYLEACWNFSSRRPQNQERAARACIVLLKSLFQK